MAVQRRPFLLFFFIHFCICYLLFIIYYLLFAILIQVFKLFALCIRYLAFSDLFSGYTGSFRNKNIVRKITVSERGYLAYL